MRIARIRLLASILVTAIAVGAPARAQQPAVDAPSSVTVSSRAVELSPARSVSLPQVLFAAGLVIIAAAWWVRRDAEREE